AEAGIRYDLVTGVQTCALPIYGQGSPLRPPNLMRVCRWALRPCPILRLYEAAHCPQPLPLSWRRRCRLLPRGSAASLGRPRGCGIRSAEYGNAERRHLEEHENRDSDALGLGYCAGVAFDLAKREAPAGSLPQYVSPDFPRRLLHVQRRGSGCGAIVA